MDRFHHCHFAVVRGSDLSADDVEKQVGEYMDWFRIIEPRDGKMAQFKAFVIIFPELPQNLAAQLIDDVQARLKSTFVASGLMLGEFHPYSDKVGLWNEDFRPLRAPHPMLAIRHIVPTDWPFLKGDREWVQAYIEAVGDSIPKRLIHEVESSLIAHGLPESGLGSA